MSKSYRQHLIAMMRLSVAYAAMNDAMARHASIKNKSLKQLATMREELGKTMQEAIDATKEIRENILEILDGAIDDKKETDYAS